MRPSGDLPIIPAIDHPSRLHTAEQVASYLGQPVLRRFALANMRAAWWTWRSLRYASARLKADGLNTVLNPPPDLPAGARRGVDAVLRRRDPTCLERSLVHQAWLAAHGVRCEVVVGVARRDSSVAAHAWLDLESGKPRSAGYSEIHRIPPR